MRTLPVAVILTFIGLGAHAAGDEPISITQLPYPAEVSLVQDAMGWTYRQNPSNLPLYLYEPASPGASNCNHSCERQWLPLLVPPAGKPLGEWTILMRSDHRRQWAFEQHAVYTHVHDSPGDAAGARAGGAWHLMPHFRS